MGARKKWLFVILSSFFASTFIFLSSLSGFGASYAFVTHKTYPIAIRNGMNYPPAFGYYIYGSRGEKEQVFRLLLAVYHPRNRYLLHLGTDASQEERGGLAGLVKSVPFIRAFENVDILGMPDPMTYMGATNIVATLHAAAVLLKVDSGWNWFITLSATDYPLVTQDDLSHLFSSVNRHLSFIDHTSDLGWKETQRVQPIVVDPGIYLARKTKIFHATEKRPTPDAFKIFTGSPWVILSRSFLEFCILGWDNLPRTLLMYFNNVILPQECYFHSVICNSPEFKNTTVNADLRYMAWDNPPKMEPHFLDTLDYERMSLSGAAFARQFRRDDSVLDMVDEKILKRRHNRATPGGWCTGRRGWLMDPCSEWGDINVLKLSPQSKKLKETIVNLLDDANLHSRQCK